MAAKLYKQNVLCAGIDLKSTPLEFQNLFLNFVLILKLNSCTPIFEQFSTFPILHNSHVQQKGLCLFMAHGSLMGSVRNHNQEISET